MLPRQGGSEHLIAFDPYIKENHSKPPLLTEP